MLNIKVHCGLLVFLVGISKIYAESSKCEQKEKHLAVLDLAKESISKAKDLHPSCIEDENVSKCGAKEKVSAYLDIAMTLIEDAKKNYSSCDVTRKLYNKPIDCLEVLKNGDSKSGIYIIFPRHRVFEGKSLKVYCDMETDGGGWTMIQRRGNFSKKVEFYRDWKDYKKGFGDISEEFWLGNENIFALTNQRSYSVRFDMQKVEKDRRYATYSSFWIDAETADYTLHLGSYNGTAGDGIFLPNTRNMKFSTKDKKNYLGKHPCTDRKKGGWWYSDCGLSNPNGMNLPGGKNDWKYMNWKTWTEYDSLLAIEMKIR